MSFQNYFKLVGKTAIPCTTQEWADWFGKGDRRVGDTNVGPLRISMIFLGLNHAFDDGPPQIFETMVFGDDPKSPYSEFYCERYSTWAEAEEGHRIATQWAVDRVAEANKAVTP